MGAKTVVTWILTVLPAIAFIGAGAMKLTGGSVAQFEGWGYPGGFSYVIGVVELVGGALLLWPRAMPYAAAVLVGDMLGAAVTHAVHAEWPMIGVNVALIAMLVVAGWFRRPEWVDGVLRRDARPAE